MKLSHFSILNATPIKSILIGAFICFTSSSFSQDNTLPTTGNVGVGTLNPSARLDVNGNAIIDSCLLIKDSLQVNKTIRTMGKMFVEQKMTMKGNAVVKQNFRVNGNSRIDGNQRTFGNSRVDGLLKLPNTTTLSDQLFNAGNFELLVLKPNGTTKKIDYDSLLQKMGDGMYGSDLSPGEICKHVATAPIPSPRWSNGVNKPLWTESP